MPRTRSNRDKISSSIDSGKLAFIVTTDPRSVYDRDTQQFIRKHVMRDIGLSRRRCTPKLSKRDRLMVPLSLQSERTNLPVEDIPEFYQSEIISRETHSQGNVKSDSASQSQPESVTSPYAFERIGVGQVDPFARYPIPVPLKRESLELLHQSQYFPPSESFYLLSI